MIRFLVAALFAILAAAAAAQTVPVRSADHPGFSRIVLHLPERSAWRWEETGEGRILRVGRAGLKFDTSGVFDRMTDSRVTSVTPLGAPPGLRLGIGCACTLDVSWHGTSMLVVDIADAAPGTEDARPASLPLSRMGSHAAAALAAPGIAPGLWPAAPPAEDEELVVTPEPELPHADLVLASAREVMVRQIARAAGLGMVTMRGGAASAAPTSEAELDEYPPGGEAQEPAVGDAARFESHMTAENGVDLATGDNVSGIVHGVDGDPCIPARLLDLPGWGTSEAFATQVGTLRARLVGEFDRVQPDAVLALARLYLYFGFGAEARQVLILHGAGDAEEAVLLSLAAIMDGEPAGTTLSGQTDCDSDTALWSALSYDSLPADLPLDVDAMLRALNRLPAHLRRIAAPQLARKFMDAGHMAAAERVLRILDRGPAPMSSDRTFLHAETILADEAAGAGAAREAADVALGQVIEANEDSAAEALVRRIDTRLKSGRGVPTEMAELAGAYALEHRGTPIGDDLLRAYLEATAASGDFGMAFREFARLTPDLTSAAQDRILSTILGLMTEAADDLTFINHALRLRDVAPERVDQSVANALAGRLVMLGFPTEATSYLRARADGPAIRERQVLRAEIALAQDLPHQAQVELLGLTGEDVNLLRARAHSMAGRHRAAHNLFLASGATQEATTEAVLAGAWGQLGDTADPAMAQMARLIAATTDGLPPAAEDQGVLAANQALLDEAATARDVVMRLLESRPAPMATE